MFHDVHAAIELPGLLILSDDRANAGRCEKSRNTCARRSHAFRECTLWNQVQLNFALQNHLLQQLIFADIASDMSPNLSCSQQEAHRKTVHANVITDRGQILHALANKGSDQVLRDATKSEATDHNGGAIGDVANGLVRVSNNFVHEK